MGELLRIDNVEKYYGGRGVVTKALDNISFQVNDGEFLAIMGASGSGKTTLLNCIATIDTVSSGHIYLSGTDIASLPKSKTAEFRQHNLGFVFQDYNLLDTLTMGENIALALTIGKEKHNQVEIKVVEEAKSLGIDHLLNKFPYEVSGGERQRCACARAIISKPKLILADEPTGALDSKSAQIMLDVLLRMNRERNSTILMVTHDIFTASYSSRILFLRDGKIYNEIRRGDKSRRDFWSEILDVVTMLGGDVSNAG